MKKKTPPQKPNQPTKQTKKPQHIRKRQVVIPVPAVVSQVLVKLSN